LQLEVYDKIQKAMDKIKAIEGVIGVVLFGSYSRGDYDEGSDVDVLVVFNSTDAREKGLRKVYRVTADIDLFFQVIGLTIEELRRSFLLETAMREGKIYFASEEVKEMLTTKRRPYALITYHIANLTPKERVLFTQKLEGRGRGKYKYEGLIHKVYGYKVGRGVVMIPVENLKAITQYLEKEHIDYVIRYVWA